MKLLPSRPLSTVDAVRRATVEVYRSDTRKVLTAVNSILADTEAVRPSTCTAIAETRDSRPYVLESLPIRDSSGLPILSKERAFVRRLAAQADSISESLANVRRTDEEASRPRHYQAMVKGAPHPLTISPRTEADYRSACLSLGAVSRDPQSRASLRPELDQRARDRDLSDSVDCRLDAIGRKRSRRGGKRVNRISKG